MHMFEVTERLRPPAPVRGTDNINVTASGPKYHYCTSGGGLAVTLTGSPVVNAVRIV